MAVKVTRDLYKFVIAGLGWSPNINKRIRIITTIQNRELVKKRVNCYG